MPCYRRGLQIPELNVTELWEQIARPPLSKQVLRIVRRMVGLHNKNFVCFTKVILTALRQMVAQTIKGVISTDRGSVWFGLVRNRSDFDASGSVNRKRVYGSVCDQSEPSS